MRVQKNVWIILRVFSKRPGGGENHSSSFNIRPAKGVNYDFMRDLYYLRIVLHDILASRRLTKAAASNGIYNSVDIIMNKKIKSLHRYVERKYFHVFYGWG